MPTTFSRRQDTGVRAWVRRHPLTAFLIMGVGLALLVMSVAIWLKSASFPAVPFRGASGWRWSGSRLSILVLFPASLLITALEGGRPALRELFARMLRWRVGHRLVGVRAARAPRQPCCWRWCSATRRICPARGSLPASS